MIIIRIYSQDGIALTGSRDLSTHTLNLPDEKVQAAITMRRLPSANITRLREAVPTAFSSAKSLTSTYDLKDKFFTFFWGGISARGIYRALNHLCEQGAAARIESLSAYIACRRLRRLPLACGVRPRCLSKEDNT